MTTRTSMIDLCICHAWRRRPVWLDLDDMLGTVDGFSFRNFGLPWYDPIIDPATEEGQARLRGLAEAQIRNSKVALVLPELAEGEQSRPWFEFQLGVARDLKRPIIVVDRRGKGEIPDWIAAQATTTVGWDAGAIVAAIRGLGD